MDHNDCDGRMDIAPQNNSSVNCTSEVGKSTPQAVELILLYKFNLFFF